MSETIFIGQQAHLQGMNVFDIGGNKNHINFGLMNSQLSSLSSEISKISSSTTHLAIPGYVLSLLEEADSPVLDSLKRLVKENKISLLSVPYYNSSISLISSKELEKQLFLQEKILKKHFKKSSVGFLCTEKVLPPSVEDVLNNKFKEVFYPKDSKLTLTNPTYKLNETSLSFLGESVENLSDADSKMEAHLMAELREMYSPILSFGDEDSLDSWRFMTQSSMITRSSVSKFSNSAYEHYTHMMNTLNDIAHKINTVNLAKKGLFQDRPNISDSPSSIIIN